MSESTRCILLLVDGLRADVAEARLAAGDLPHLDAMLRGGGRTRAVTVFPSTTSVAYLPFLTGCAPGHCNIPSIRWLDRRRYHGRWWRDRAAVRSYCGYQAGLLDYDIAGEVRTIFELVPRSLGIFTPIARGLAPERDPSRGERKAWGALAHYARWHQPSDNAVARHLLRGAAGDSRFIFAQFPAVDGYTHQSGPDSAPVHRALRRVDQTVGALREQLARQAELDRTLILLVSDHGATEVHTHVDLPDWFRSRGVATLSHPVLWEHSPRGAVMVAGNGSAMVYARPAESRRERWPVERLREPESFGSSGDLIGELVSDPAVALVAGESVEGGLWVESSAGAARIRPAGSRVSYQPLTGDPLGIGGAGTATVREWLETTCDGPFPDAIFNLLDQFRAERTGDLVIVAREGFDFRGRYEVPEHRAGHGSLIRPHMQTPIWASSPTPGEALRTVDLFPAMLDWLGVTVPDGIDGERIWRPSPVERRLPPGRAGALLSVPASGVPGRAGEH